MNDPNTYYQEHATTYRSEADTLYKRMTLLSTLRIVVFLATAFGIYITFSNWQLAVIIGVFGIGIFIYLLSKHADVKVQRQLKLALVSINIAEIEIASGNFHTRDSGLQFQNHIISIVWILISSEEVRFFSL